MAVIFYGLGGIGTGILLRVKKLLEETEGGKNKIDHSVFFFGLDIQKDYDVKSVGTDIERFEGLEINDPTGVIRTRWERPEFKKWWISKPSGEYWFSSYPISHTTEAGRIRANGRLVFHEFFPKIKNFVEASLNKAKISRAVDADISFRDNTIFVVSSLGGGTGSGMLIDFTFLLRDLVGKRAKIFGIFIDGTVTSKFAPGSGLQSIAALTEIERWNCKPREFQMEYLGGSIPSNPQSPLDRFFDGILLVQYKNEDDRNFLGRETGNLCDDYKELVAEFLYPFAITDGEILSGLIDNFRRLEGLRLYEGRATRYGSFAISSIIFPYRKIAKKLAARWISEKIVSSGGLRKANLPRIEEVIKEKALNIEDIRSNIRINSEYNNILSKLDTTKSLIEEADKKIVIKEIENNHWTNYTMWNEKFEKYKKEARDKIKEKIDRISAEIREIIRDEIVTLDLEGIRDWLFQLEGKIEDLYSDIAKINLSIPSEKFLNQLFSELDEEVNKKIFSKWRSARTNYVEEFSTWVNRTLQSIENYAIKEFYNDLMECISQLIYVVEEFKNIYETVTRPFVKEAGKLRENKALYDETRFTQGDYPLNIEIKNPRVVEECYKKVEESIKPDSLINNLKVGSGEIISIPEMFDTIYNGIYRKSEVEIRDFKLHKEKEMKKNLTDLLMDNIVKRCKEILFDVYLWDALEWNFESLYNKIKEATPREKQSIRARLILDFTDTSVEQMLRPEIIEDYNKWKEVAFEGLIGRLNELTKPFWKTDEGEIGEIREQFKETYELLSRDALTRIYVPKIPDTHRYLLESIKKVINKELEEMEHDRHRLSIIKMEFIATLNTLTQLKPLVIDYLSHRENFLKQDGVPAHADMRFYREWKDNIMEKVPEMLEEKEFAILIYGLGLGTGIIKRTKSRFIYKGKTLTKSLPKLLENLMQSSEIKMIKEIEEVLERLWANTPKSEVVDKFQDIFVKATKLHRDIEPPNPAAEPHKIWKEVHEMICAERTREGNIVTETLGRLVPRDSSGIEQLLNRLKVKMKK